MPYRVLVDQTQVLNDLSPRVLDDGRQIGYDHESLVWYKDEVIPDDKISPVVVKLYDEGDAHTRSILERVGDKPQEVEAVSQATPEDSGEQADGAQEAQEPAQQEEPETPTRQGRRTRGSAD